ncbi:zinc finger protein 593 [Lampetra fluviatilis]
MARTHKQRAKKSKLMKVKRRTRDLDQVHGDMRPESAGALLHQPEDLDLPGNAQHYCLHCARYFIDLQTLKVHFKTKTHKQRLKRLREAPFSQEEAERAAGMGSYQLPAQVKVQTQPVEEEEAMCAETTGPTPKKQSRST